MYPGSGFRSGGTCERTLVPVFFVPGEHPNVPSFRFSFRRNIRQNHPFGNHPFGFLRKKNRAHTHILLFGNQLPSYTGHLLHRAFWQEFFCVFGRFRKVLSAVNAPITHINRLELIFSIAHTSVTQKIRFRIVSVMISGLIEFCASPWSA